MYIDLRQKNNLLKTTGPFTIFHTPEKEIGEFSVVQKRETDFQAHKLWKKAGTVGCLNRKEL